MINSKDALGQEGLSKYVADLASKMANEILSQGVDVQKQIMAGLVALLAEGNNARGEIKRDTQIAAKQEADILFQWVSVLEKMKG